jgi:Flp pilus assembly protein TadD
MASPPSLRPRSITQLLDEAIRLYRTHFGALTRPVRSIVGGITLVLLLIQLQAGGRIDWHTLSPLRAETLFDTIDLVVTGIMPLSESLAIMGPSLAFYLVVQLFLTVLLITEVARVHVGPAAAPQRAPGIERTLTIIPALFALLPAYALGAVCARMIDDSGVFIAALLYGDIVSLADLNMLFGGYAPWLLIMLLTVAITARFVFAAPVIALEEGSAFLSFARSWRLTHGMFLQIYTIITLGVLLAGFLYGLPHVLSGVSLGFAVATPIIEPLVALLSQLVQALVLPLQLAIITLAYYNARARNEGYDLELIVQQASASDITALTERGSSKLQAGDALGALAEFDQALRLRPDDLSLLYSRIDARSQAGDFAGALADCERVLQLAPKDPIAFSVRAYVKEQAGDLVGARADYGQALKLRPNLISSLGVRATAAFERGDHDEAQRDLTLILRFQPDDAWALYNSACVYARQGNPDQALERLARAIERDRKWRDQARGDKDFETLREDARFVALVGKELVGTRGNA